MLWSCKLCMKLHTCSSNIVLLGYGVKIVLSLKKNKKYEEVLNE